MKGTLRVKAGLTTLFAATAFVTTNLSATAKRSNCSQLVVFGDSYSDTGYGYVDGNGPTAIAYAAHKLGIALLPADTGKPGDSLNYAVSGATTERSDGQTIGRAFLGYGMLSQGDAFARDVRSGRAKFEPEKTVFFLAGGLNDSKLSSSQTLQNLGKLIENLHRVGARRFVVARLPVTIAAFPAGNRLNPQFPTAIAALSKRYPDSYFDLSDWGPMFDKVRGQGKVRGFVEMNVACAGRSIFGQDSTPCRTPNAYYFYHDGHPSTEVHRQVGELLFQEAIGSWCGGKEVK